MNETMSDKHVFESPETDLDDHHHEQEKIFFNLETPSASSFADDDTNHKPDKFYSNLEEEHLSYICGSDVLIGASEIIADISPVLDVDSTNVLLNSFHDVPTDAALVILSQTSMDDPVNLIADTPHEILVSELDAESTALVTSIDDRLVDVPSVQSEAPLSVPLVVEPRQPVSSRRKPKKEVKKVKGKRGRKPYFKNNTKPTCTICSTEFTNTASLKTHMLIHSGERPFQCDLCEKSFTRKTVLKIHRRLHTGEKPYQCKSCPNGFVTKEALARHVAKDHPDKSKADLAKERPSHVCEVCKKVLCSKYSLRSHMNIHRIQENDEEEAGKECKFCKKKFTCQYTLRRHVFEKHNRRGIITCNVCEESFSSNWEYSRHQDLHAPSRKFQCDLCSKTFGKKFQLLYHLQVHEAEKKCITCYLCKKEYNSRDTFLEHIIEYMKSEMQIYSCPQCPISFSDPRQLKLHLNETHKLPVISDVNYCDICKISLRDANEYYEHLFQKHDHVDILCNECDYYFKSRRQYDEHLMAHFV